MSCKLSGPRSIQDREFTFDGVCSIAKEESRIYRRPFVIEPVQNPPQTDEQSPVNSTVWFTGGRFAAMLAALIAIQFWDVLLGSHTFFYRDYSLFGYPNAHILSAGIWNGEIPLWNPDSHCGIPHLAQWNTLVCYPPAILASALPQPWSLGFFCLLHLFAAGMTMRTLAFRWTGNELAAGIAGLAYAFNGLTINCLMWPNFMAGLAWAPIVLLTASNAWRSGGIHLIWAALVGALQMLSGIPEIILITWSIAGLLFFADLFFRPENRVKSTLLMGALLGLVTALAAVQLFPFLQLLLHSQRSPDYGEGHWPMPLLGVLNFVVPLFRCTPGTVGGVFSQYDQQFTSSYYAGIGVLALAVAAAFVSKDRRVKILGIATLAFVVMAMGDAGGLHLAVRKVFPPIGFARYPVKFLFGALMLIPLLAAFGFKQLWSHDLACSGNRKWRSIALLGATILVTSAIVISYFKPDRAEVWTVTMESGITRLLLLCAFVIGMRFAATFRKRNECIAAQCGLIFLLALDLTTHTPRQNPTVVTWAYSSETVPRDLIPVEGYRAMVAPSHRAVLNQIATPDHLGFCIGQRTALSHNWNLIEGIPKIDGFFSLQLRKQHAIWKILYGGELPPPESLLDFLGASQISDPASLFTWTARTNAMPLVTVGQAPLFANSEDDALTQLASPKFNPRKTVILDAEEQAGTAKVKPNAARITSVMRSSAHAIEIEVEATAPSLIVIAQSHYSPWRAMVNDSAAPILSANHAFQAVLVPSGRSQVRIEYRDTMFHIGAVISFLSLIACAAALIRARRESRAAAPIPASND